MNVGQLHASVLLDIAIVFTSLAWGLGFYVGDRRLHVVQALATGCFVCLIGYTASDLGWPAWAVIAAPLPVDFAMLWYAMRTPRRMAIAYVAIWAFYLALHVGLSALVHYDLLIPSWRLHG